MILSWLQNQAVSLRPLTQPSRDEEGRINHSGNQELPEIGTGLRPAVRIKH
jgi:hypothetical protein